MLAAIYVLNVTMMNDMTISQVRSKFKQTIVHPMLQLLHVI